MSATIEKLKLELAQIDGEWEDLRKEETRIQMRILDVKDQYCEKEVELLKVQLAEAKQRL